MAIGYTSPGEPSCRWRRWAILPNTKVSDGSQPPVVLNLSLCPLDTKLVQRLTRVLFRRLSSVHPLSARAGRVDTARNQKRFSFSRRTFCVRAVLFSSFLARANQ